MIRITRFMLLLLTVAWFTAVSCENNQNSEIQTDKSVRQQLNEAFLEELKNNKIVMVSDNYHGHTFYYALLLGMLETWLDEVNNNPNSNAPRKLILFLESLPEDIETIHEFFRNTDIKPYVDVLTRYNYTIGSNSYTIDNIEFKYRLKDLLTRIDEINSSKSQNKIDLKILGLESEVPESITDVYLDDYELFDKRRYNWFADVRDSLSSRNIEMALRDHPEYKGIVFIGSGHLRRGLVLKRWDSNPDKSRKGYFLPHYLDNIYGRENISIIINIHAALETDQEYLKKKIVLAEKYDVIARIRIVPPFPIPLQFLKSKLYLNSLYKVYSKQYLNNKNNNNRKLNRFVGGIVTELSCSYLSIDNELMDIFDKVKTTGEKQSSMEHLIPTVQDYIKRKVSTFDAVQSIVRIKEWYKREPYWHYPDYAKGIRSILSNINSDFKYWYTDGGIPTNELSEEELKLIESNIDEITIYSLIKLLWIADEKEKTDAIEYLTAETGQNFTTAREWNDWWMKKYYPAQ